MLHSQLSCFSLSTSWSYVVTALCRLFLFFVVVDLVFCAFAPVVMITGKVVVITHGDILKIEIFYGWFQFLIPQELFTKLCSARNLRPTLAFSLSLTPLRHNEHSWLITITFIIFIIRLTCFTSFTYVTKLAIFTELTGSFTAGWLTRFASLSAKSCHKRRSKLTRLNGGIARVNFGGGCGGSIIIWALHVVI